jgi:acetyl/propionyl-CoA carboxylase alpha subunit
VSLRTDTNAPPFARVLVANRGEIAIRVMRACRELGVRSIAVYSDADRHALHVRHADAGERIGPANPSASYLSIDAILDAARRAGADAIHPGYGFLSENDEFARAVEDAGLTFIGPPAETLRLLGNKVAARRSAAAAGVPTVPGTDVTVGDDVSAVAALGLPVMLKAAAGGGGRGMRRVESLAELGPALAAARREAAAAFGDDTVYAERVVAPAHHVEVQLLGDRQGGLAVLGERDCSVQRRHQKLLEESPSPAIGDDTRQALFASARRVAGAVEFHNAATVEFLVDDDGQHYFLEMNTRLQVEHGVTELVTGIDMVAWQIRVAAGEPLPPTILEAPTAGHAIEVRLYAEDPYDNFAPRAGRVTAWRMPDGPGVRVDAGVEADTDLPAEYDPLLAKVLVHASDRAGAIARLRRALDETLVGGVQTDAGFHRWLVDHPRFVAGRYDTSFIPDEWGSGAPPTDEERAAAAAAAMAARRTEDAGWRPAPGAHDHGSAWGRLARRESLRP